VVIDEHGFILTIFGHEAASKVATVLGRKWEVSIQETRSGKFQVLVTA
jgi:hypothetical protein